MCAKRSAILHDRYQRHSIFKEGYADIQRIDDHYLALKKGHFALANTDGMIYSDFDYTLITQPVPNTFLLQTSAARYQLFNRSTQKINTTIFDTVQFHKTEACITVKKENTVGLLDSTHAFILDLTPGKNAFSDKGIAIVAHEASVDFYIDNTRIDLSKLMLKSYEVLSRDFISTWDNPAQKYIVSTKNITSFPAIYKYKYTALSADMLTFGNGTNYGIINAKGEIMLPMEYQSVTFNSDGNFNVIQNHKTGIVSTTGTCIFKPQFDYIEPFNKDGIALASNAGLWGIISKNGKILIPLQYSDIEITSETWKCYRNQGMDLYNLKTPVTVDEMLTFNHVGTIRVKKIPERDDRFNTVMDNPDQLPQRKKESTGRYKLTSESIYYPPSTKIKALLPHVAERVKNLYGIRDMESNKTLVRNVFWDIELHEFASQEYCRIILSGDKQALFSKTGRIKSYFTFSQNGVKKGGNAVYIGPYRHGLARINVGGRLISGTDISEPSFRESFSSHSLECSGGAWGFVDGNGDLAIGIRYEYVSDFRNGRSIVKTGGKYGVIDTLEQWVIPAQYDKISYLEDSDYQYFKLTYNKSDWGILSDDGKVLMPAEYEKTGTIAENRIPVKQFNRWGAYNYAGIQVIPLKYEYLTGFSEGKAAYKLKNKWGFIDSSGHIITEAIYIDTKAFHEGYAAVNVKGKWGYVDAGGKEVIAPQYARTTDFHGRSAGVYINKKWHFIDTANNIVLHKKFTKVTEFNELGLSKTRKGKRWHLFDEVNGKLLPNVKYKNIAAFSDSLAAFQNKSGKYGFIDTKGKVVIPAMYDKVGNFSEGFARVKLKKGKWGYINQKNILKIHYAYKSANDFHEGKAVVCEAKKACVLDTAGKILFELQEQETGFYQDNMLLIGSAYYNEHGKKEMGPFMKASPMTHHVAIVEVLDQGWRNCQMINRKNNVIAAYRYISIPKEHISTFQISNLHGIADLQGKVIAKANYQQIKSLGNGIFKITDFDKTGYINTKAVWVWKPTR